MKRSITFITKSLWIGLSMMICLGSICLNGQDTMVFERVYVDLKPIRIYPENTYNKRTYSRVLDELKTALEQQLTNFRFSLTPDLELSDDKFFVQSDSVYRKVELWPQLQLPDNLRNIQEFYLKLETVEEVDGQQIKNIAKQNLGSDTKSFSQTLMTDFHKSLEELNLSNSMWEYFRIDTTGMDFSVEQLRSYEEDGFDLWRLYNEFYSLNYARGDSLYAYQAALDTFEDRSTEACQKVLKAIHKYSRFEQENLPVVDGIEMDLNSIFWEKKQRMRHLPQEHARKTNAFNILIFPFDAYDDCGNDLSYACTKAVNEQLQKRKGDKNIEVKINRQFNLKDKPLTYEVAEEIKQVTGADLLIWGDYAQPCQWDSTLVNIKYYSSVSKSREKLLGNKKETGYLKIPSIVSLISDQSLYGDINDLVNLCLGEASQNCEDKLSLFNSLSVDKDSEEFVKLLVDVVYCHWKNKDEQLEEKVLDLYSRFPDHYAVLDQCAYYYRTFGPVEKEYEFLDIILKQHPTRAHFQVYLNCYARLKKLPELLEGMDKYYVPVNGKDLSYHQYKAEALRRMRQLPEAIDQFEKVIVLDSTSSHLQLKMAGFYAQSNQFEKARAHCEKALELTPTYTKIGRGVAQVYLHPIKDTTAAIDALELVLAATNDPSSCGQDEIELAVFLARLLFTTGDCQRAWEHMEYWRIRDKEVGLIRFCNVDFDWNYYKVTECVDPNQSTAFADSMFTVSNDHKWQYQMGTHYLERGDTLLARDAFKEVLAMSKVYNVDAARMLVYSFLDSTKIDYQDSLALYTKMMFEVNCENNKAQWLASGKSMDDFRGCPSQIIPYKFYRDYLNRSKGGRVMMDVLNQNVETKNVMTVFSEMEELLPKLFEKDTAQIKSVFSSLWNYTANIYFETKQWETGIDFLEQANSTSSPYLNYNAFREVEYYRLMGQFYAQSSHPEKSIEYLDAYIYRRLGETSRLDTAEKRYTQKKRHLEILRKDRRLEKIKDTPAFQALIKKYEHFIENSKTTDKD